MGQRIEGLTEEAEILLLAHGWPGNARELKNAIQGALSVERSAVVDASSLAAFMWGI
jgi:transcriptional regulator with PAS, ATPase and Fis domain